MVFGIPQMITLLKKDQVKVFVDREGNEFTDMDANTLHELEMAAGVARGQNPNDSFNGSSSLEPSPPKRFPGDTAPPPPSSGPPTESSNESPAKRLGLFSNPSPVKPVSPAGRRHTLAVPSRGNGDGVPLFPLGSFSPQKKTSVVPAADMNETKEEPESQPHASTTSAAAAAANPQGAPINAWNGSAGNYNEASAASASMGVGAQFFARPDQSAATTQFSLQLWLQQLLEQNDLLREQLGLPQHKKSRAKTMDLIFSPEPLNVSGINFLIHFAEELAAENMSMQRLVQQGGGGADAKDRRGGSPSKYKQRNSVMETQDAANRKMSTFPGDLTKRIANTPATPEISEAVRKQSTFASTITPGAQLASPSPDSAGAQGTPATMQPLSKRALGYADDQGTMPNLQEKPREPIESRRFPELSRLQSVSKVPSSNRLMVDGDSSVKVGTDPPSSNQIETSIKHDKLEKRQKYARRMYSMTGVPK